MQGGLQSITNTTTVTKNASATGSAQSFVDAKMSTAVPIVSGNVDAKKTKTPSPNKVAIRVEPPSGKENYTGTPQSSK